MAIDKTRGAIRKLGPISLGHKITRFRTHGNDKRTFAVHEDLVCAHSILFKKKLQKVRKPLEGECSICHEELDPSQGDIAFCQGSCGQNMHEKCIEQWTHAQRGGQPTCPMCRKPWKKATESVVDLDCKLDSDAIQLYIDWLYTGQLCISEAIDRASDDYNISLLKAWAVSSIVRDKGFTGAIVVEHLEGLKDGLNSGFKIDAICHAFENPSSRSMKELVVESFHINGCPEYLEIMMEQLPVQFVRDLCMYGMHAKHGDVSTTNEELLSDWMDVLKPTVES